MKVLDAEAQYKLHLKTDLRENLKLNLKLDTVVWGPSM